MVPDMVLKPKQEPHKHLGINWTQLKYPKYHLATQVIKKKIVSEEDLEVRLHNEKIDRRCWRKQVWSMWFHAGDVLCSSTQPYV